MDIATLDTLNAMLGNDATAAGIECALSGGQIEVTMRVALAFGGASASVSLNGKPIDAYRVVICEAGDLISIEAPTRGRFLYFALAGGVDVPVVMKSRSTYVPAAFGGLEGRRLRSGDMLAVAVQARRTRHYVRDKLPETLVVPLERPAIRFVPRGDSDLPRGEWTLSAASDRTGYRIGGRAIEGGASITSEGVCPGVIQLPPGGEPIVLMSDAPTVGGYRVVGAVITADLGALAQLTPGSRLIFDPVSVETAQREVASELARLERIRKWSLS